MADRRDLARQLRWWDRVNPGGRTVTATLPCPGEDYADEEMEVAIRWVVCGTCEGRGTHVNPSIDAHGISAEEFAEDPDFEEDYRSGVYEVACEECGGRCVVPEPLDADIRERVDALIAGRLEIEHAYESERRMGA